MLKMTPYLRHVLEDSVPWNVEKQQALVEVMSLERRAGIERGQRVLGLDLEGVCSPAVIEIVAEAPNHQAESLNLLKNEVLKYLKFLKTRIVFTIENCLSHSAALSIENIIWQTLNP